MDELVDLRSDTVTKPSPAMLSAMAAAPVGDDVYGEDPTINELEARTAEVLGLEAGLFCPSGTMSNVLGVWTLVPVGKEILCDAGAHIARAEMGAHAALHGVTMRTWVSDHGMAKVDDVAALLSVGTGPYLVETAAIEIENTHNFAGGIVQPFELLRDLRALASANNILMHLDGARLWNAHVATGVLLEDYGRLFDTVSVCYSKGMGAPVGSVLAGSADAIAAARVQRKRLGGGMRQAGVLAAGALYALDHNLTRLADDHANARLLAQLVDDDAPGLVETPQTNIIIIDTPAGLAPKIAASARADGVLISVLGPHTLRAVTHLDVDEAGVRRAARVLVPLLVEASRLFGSD